MAESRPTASTGERKASTGSQAGRSGTPLSWPWLQIANVWRKRTSRAGGPRRLRGMTTILRKYHSVARCTLLGEMIEDTAHRYYYRPHVGGELTFVDKNRRPSTSRRARRARTGPPANNAAAPSGRTRDDIDPRRRRPGSSSANRLVARRLVGRPDAGGPSPRPRSPRPPPPAPRRASRPQPQAREAESLSHPPPHPPFATHPSAFSAPPGPTRPPENSPAASAE